MRDQSCFTTWSDGRQQVQAAVGYAERVHSGQRSDDGTPFILHPLEVASLLRETGAPDHVVAAGLLHDVLEKTEASASELLERFGRSVTRLVVAVSEDPRIRGYASRKAELRRQAAAAGEDALAVFAADKVSKLREVRRDTAREGTSGAAARGRERQRRARRIRHFRACLRLLEKRIPQSPLVSELRAEFRRQLRDRGTRESLAAGPLNAPAREARGY